MVDKRELRMHCKDCKKYFSAQIDLSLDGNHEISCPYCGFMHYRVVENLEIVGDHIQPSLPIIHATTKRYSPQMESEGPLERSWKSTLSGSQLVRTEGGTIGAKKV